MSRIVITPANVGRLIHHSAQPLRSVRDVEQRELAGRYLSAYEKPLGLWVSCADHEQNWHEWCQSENFGKEGFAFENEIILSADAELLTLTCADDLDEFTHRFGVETGSSWRPVERCIAWRRVSEQFAGILIAPYIWSRRNADHTCWYYGWECASGCIWDASAIAHIETVAISVPA